jgi:hypothetical protein
VLLAGDDVGPREAANSVRLLPHFDCYLRGFFPRDRLAARLVRDRAAGGTGNVPVLLVDGMVAGVWERRPAGKRRIRVRVDAFENLDRAQRRELEAEAGRVGRILGADAELELGEVAVRPHL